LEAIHSQSSLGNEIDLPKTRQDQPWTELVRCKRKWEERKKLFGIDESLTNINQYNVKVNQIIHIIVEFKNF
jgi:hypothetical protein